MCEKVTMTDLYESAFGMAATVLCIDKPKGLPVVAFLENGAVILADEYGRMNPKVGPSPFDLIKVRNG